jgi:cell wall-associated NlpC family hydrolase
MGAAAQRAGLPPELPVMASLTEAGLHNLPYGDRDSMGFFQMRLSIWDSGQYAGYPSNPELQLEWFINHALAVQQQYPELAQNPDSWGQWIADVEQPAAQYRYRYQLQLDEARSLLAGANLQPSTQAPAPAQPADAAAAAVPAAPPVQIAAGEEALGVAMRYIGTPYKWGGSDPATGFDCSGLVQYAYAQEGVQLPRVAAEQFDVGIPVPRDRLQPGDAVFFADPNGYVHHVGLYIGGGRFVDAPETGQNVQIDSLSNPYFAEQYAGARRYTAAALVDPKRFARTIPTVPSP